MTTRFGLACLLLAVGLQCIPESALAQYRGTPYPPGCFTLPQLQDALYGSQSVHVWSGTITVDTVARNFVEPKRKTSQVSLDLYRVGCAEPGRSIIVAEFRLPQVWVDPVQTQLILPDFVGETGFDPLPFHLRSEPNGARLDVAMKTTWGDYTDGWWDARGYVWRYVLDTDWEFEESRYNSDFLTLQVVNHDQEVVAIIDMPATDDVLQPGTSLALNGRLSGTWVESGARDQGLVLTFSNLVPAGGIEVEHPEEADLSVFLSWFTFDPQGQGLWLTANTSFAQGETSIDLPIVRVGDGQFLGSKRANRSIAGHGTLHALNCNELVFDYALDDIGLGSGQLQLQRLFALEIDGYPCRDRGSREASLALP
jgi:hypothetical protein